MTKRAFTLIEVNLAMLIMAGGILSIVGLYSFGFRENRQSREDIASTALADSVVAPLVTALSATNIPWSVFRREQLLPSKEAWGYYLDDNGIVKGDPQSTAQQVFGKVDSWVGKYSNMGSFPSAVMQNTGMKCGLVVQHSEDSAIVRISFRATRHPGELMAMPLFYTEVRFQGLPDE